MITYYEMPVCRDNMTAEVKEILAEMDAQNKEYSGSQKVVEIRSWSPGTPDGETVADYWRVVIYDRLSKLFFIHQLNYYWEFGITKCDKKMIYMSKDDMLACLGEAVAFKAKKGAA